MIKPRLENPNDIRQQVWRDQLTVLLMIFLLFSFFDHSFHYKSHYHYP